MKESFELTTTFNATPAEIYNAWLDSTQHAEMTGGDAECSNHVGGSFTAWDGYIEGKNIELIQNQKIVQTWRTSEFDDNDEDSTLTIQLNEFNGGTELTLSHSHIPEGQTQYKQGWQDHYFTPMKLYFEKP